MQIQYICTNISCSYPGDTQYEIQFKSESIMDINNLATPFFFFFKKEMMRSIIADTPDNSSLNHNHVSGTNVL